MRPLFIYQCGNFLWMLIGRNDNLLFCLMQLIESMEELFLGTFLSDDKLYIIDKKNINVAVFVPELFILVVLEGVDQLIGELLGRHIQYSKIGLHLYDMMSD